MRGQAARGRQTVMTAGAVRVVMSRPAAGNACRVLAFGLSSVPWGVLSRSGGTETELADLEPLVAVQALDVEHHMPVQHIVHRQDTRHDHHRR